MAFLQIRLQQALLFVPLFCFTAINLPGQQVSGPVPQSASIVGTVTDTDEASIPGATISIDGPTPADHHTVTATDAASFTLSDLHPAVPYHVTIHAQGFADWTSPELILTPGQSLELTNIKLMVGAVETSVNAVDPDKLAILQIKNAEQQRVFGVIPNFYTSYDQTFVPLSGRLKFQLAFRASTDIVTISAAAFVAGIDQAIGTPNYVQGAKGYGQRFGATYAGGVSNILIGGAILPTLLHQDPRYFYQGEGTRKSRALHALSSPFMAKGDNGRWQFNYSSVGGDLASGALSNLYYPASNRGPGLVFNNALITTAGRLANALAQEFVLPRFTSRVKGTDQK
ncbi:carboxypeptidase-like regulatory domain-containing protein [Granulicella sp. dw_53]|uniref:carboxypeptidase-like regulatory domain-containing protein n=1 Tax=Granulicella sp. dw_53 TaxID=2719792 RepID=UPI001BD28F60|nr:carboxypeptidase-like regulatory domain-containing protein [Granulicella sp. dw_53]